MQPKKRLPRTKHKVCVCVRAFLRCKYIHECRNENIALTHQVSPAHKRRHTHTCSRSNTYKLILAPCDANPDALHRSRKLVSLRAPDVNHHKCSLTRWSPITETAQQIAVRIAISVQESHHRFHLLAFLVPLRIPYATKPLHAASQDTGRRMPL